MLGDGSLGNGQMVDDVAGDASGMGYQEFDNLKPNGISQGFEHFDQTFLRFAGDIQGTALRRDSCLDPGHDSTIL